MKLSNEEIIEKILKEEEIKLHLDRDLKKRCLIFTFNDLKEILKRALEEK
jgi:hypothetical protein